MNDVVQPQKNEMNIAALTHAGGIFFGFIPSLIVWLTKKDDSAFIEQQSKEALNFQITVAIGFFAAWLLTFVLIGLILFPLVIVANAILCIIAAVNASKGAHYSYPLCLRLIT